MVFDLHLSILCRHHERSAGTVDVDQNGPDGYWVIGRIRIDKALDAEDLPAGEFDAAIFKERLRVKVTVGMIFWSVF